MVGTGAAGLSSRGRRLVRALRTRVAGNRHDRLRRANPALVPGGRVLRHPLDVPPEAVRRSNLDMVVRALEASGVPYFVVRHDTVTRTAVGVYAEHRARTLAALAAAFADEAVYLQPGDQPNALVLASEAETSAPVRRADVLRVCRFFTTEGGTLRIGMSYSCDVELWERSKVRPGFRVAPRANVAADVLPESDLAPAPLEFGGTTYRSATVFTRRMPDDVDFPVDAVYTWVDGNDPAWLERMSRHRAAEAAEADDGTREAHHALTHHPCRFRNRDELRYSLRSLTMYAPWVRHIYLVTDGQVPAWLDAGHERVTVVDHRDIFDERVLPVFNSSAITSRLHHIDGLAEHYVYVNDDVFFGRPVAPTTFFHSNGLAMIFPSRHRRPFGPPDASDLPHHNISRNIRALLERELGVTISRAVKHTPHAQLRSVQYEMEKRFADEYARTARSRFRHRDDIAADQLFHYYAYLTARAVPGTLRYTYVNVARPEDARKLDELAERRDVDAFCLNDAIAAERGGVPDEAVTRFLESYFPIASELERT